VQTVMIDTTREGVNHNGRTQTVAYLVPWANLTDWFSHFVQLMADSVVGHIGTTWPMRLNLCCIVNYGRVADADIIFLPSGFFLSSFFIPRLISAAADWMSTILPHMAWP